MPALKRVSVFVVLLKSPLGAYTSWSDTDLERLERETEKLRSAGYAISRPEEVVMDGLVRSRRTQGPEWEQTPHD